ncbi:DUF1461 domain-containing protein [Candidatus Woesearchaeota archaeon]|nr:DUF1461 domain-containing protein [Candidatus Woesearchaeota archaeon]
MKKAKEAVIIISSISLVLIYFLGSFFGLLFNTGFYEELYKNTGTYDRINEDVAKNKTTEVMEFFKGRDELNSTFFTANEISHMEDVKARIKFSSILYYMSLLPLLISAVFIFRYFKEDVAVILQKTLFYSGLSTIFIILLLAVINFSSLFSLFHKIFFSGNYTFPASSNLIKLFNQDFFKLFSKKIFAISFFKGLISAGVGGYFFYLKKKD